MSNAQKAHVLFNSRILMALIAVVIAILVIMVIIYLNPIKTTTNYVLQHEILTEHEYLDPIYVLSNSTYSLLSGIKSLLNKSLDMLNLILYYQKVNATNIINSVNGSAVKVLNELSSVNSTVSSKLSRLSNEVSESTNNIISTVENVNNSIIATVNSGIDYIDDNMASNFTDIEGLLSTTTMFYQLYGAPYAQLSPSYTLYSFPNLTLVNTLLVNLSVPQGGTVNIQCYTVPGTNIYVNAYSAVNLTAGTYTVMIKDYPCWQVVVYAPGATLNWYSGVILYQG